MTEHRRTASNAQLADDLEDLTEKVEDLAHKIEKLVRAWENATFLVAAIKWAGGFVLAVSGFWYVLTHFGQGK